MNAEIIYIFSSIYSAHMGSLPSSVHAWLVSVNYFGNNIVFLSNLLFPSWVHYCHQRDMQCVQSAVGPYMGHCFSECVLSFWNVVYLLFLCVRVCVRALECSSTTSSIKLVSCPHSSDPHLTLLWRSAMCVCAFVRVLCLCVGLRRWGKWYVQMLSCRVCV